MKAILKNGTAALFVCAMMFQPAVVSAQSTESTSLFSTFSSLVGGITDVLKGVTTLLANQGGQTLTAQVAGATGVEWYVAPNGSSGGTGSQSSPWDLQTALNGAGGKIKPGDTVWMRGGKYFGTYVARVSGSQSNPIRFIGYPGERATIDAAGANGAGTSLSVIDIQGSSDVWFQDFEIMNSNPSRYEGEGGSFANTTHGTAIYFKSGAGRDKFINLVIHDNSQGYGAWAIPDMEVYGNIIYYNGWEASDRGHGHGIYAQNQTGTKLFADNIVFYQFDNGVQAYGSSAAYIDNMTFEGNLFFNNGALSAKGMDKNILYGGGRVATNPRLISNMTYFTSGKGGENNVGYSAGCNGGEMRGNYFAGGTALALVNCSSMLIQNNSFHGGYAFAVANQFPNNTWSQSMPTTNRIFVRPNKYATGRSNVVVYNWQKLSSVQVDLSNTGLKIGDKFEVKYVLDFYGPSIVSGTYDGNLITIPMTGLKVAPPVGTVPVQPWNTAPEFGAFVVLPQSSSTTIPPPVLPAAIAPIISPNGGSFGGPVQVSLSTLTPGATIYYTTNDSDPTVLSSVYTGSFTISSSATVKAKAMASSYTDSPVSSAAFVVSQLPTNQAPSVNAGSDQTATLPSSVSLAGSATDDGLPLGSVLGYVWSKSSGPGTVTFANSGNLFTSALFSLPGAYQLRLNVSDGQLVSSDEMAVTVNAAPQSQLNCPGPATNAFTGCYYATPNLTDLKLTRTDASVNFNWGTGSPDQSIPSDDFSVSWEGTFMFEDGSYEFSVYTDDGSRLYIDGVLVLDKWFRQSQRLYTVVRTMAAGTHTVKLEHYDRDSVALVTLGWKKTGTSQTLPTATAPIISPNGGSFGGPVQVSLATLTVGSTVYYTTNGSDPTALSTIYTGPFTLSSSATVKAKAVRSGYADSSVSSAVFTISQPTPTPLPQPTGCAAGTNVFTGCYYDGTNFNILKITKTDSTINFNWGAGSPDVSIPKNLFSVRWLGNFTFDAAPYTFTVTTDDGSRLYIDGLLVLDKWFRQAPTTYTVTKTMTAGVHEVRLDYFDQDGGATIKLDWKK